MSETVHDFFQKTYHLIFEKAILQPIWGLPMKKWGKAGNNINHIFKNKMRKKDCKRSPQISGAPSQTDPVFSTADPLNRLADHKPEIHDHSINSQRIVHCADQESPMKQGDNRTGPATAGTVKACQLMYFAGTSETKNL